MAYTVDENLQVSSTDRNPEIWERSILIKQNIAKENAEKDKMYKELLRK